MSWQDAGKEDVAMRVMRDIGLADDAQLTGIQESVKKLLDEYERFMGGDLVTGLCVWSEWAQKQQARRAADDAVEIRHLRPKQAS